MCLNIEHTSSKSSLRRSINGLISPGASSGGPGKVAGMMTLSPLWCGLFLNMHLGHRFSWCVVIDIGVTTFGGILCLSSIADDPCYPRSDCQVVHECRLQISWSLALMVRFCCCSHRTCLKTLSLDLWSISCLMGCLRIRKKAYIAVILGNTIYLVLW